MKFTVLGILFIMISCKRELPPFDSKKIEGRWMITEATRKNRPTQTLDGAIVVISHDQLTHNLNGSDTSLAISWGSNYMLADTTHYMIEASLDSLLILDVRLQKYPFRITLKRLKENQTEE